MALASGLKKKIERKGQNGGSGNFRQSRGFFFHGGSKSDPDLPEGLIPSKAIAIKCIFFCFVSVEIIKDRKSIRSDPEPIFT